MTLNTGPVIKDGLRRNKLEHVIRPRLAQQFSHEIAPDIWVLVHQSRLELAQGQILVPQKIRSIIRIDHLRPWCQIQQRHLDSLSRTVTKEACRQIRGLSNRTHCCRHRCVHGNWATHKSASGGLGLPGFAGILQPYDQGHHRQFGGEQAGELADIRDYPE